MRTPTEVLRARHFEGRTKAQLEELAQQLESQYGTR